MKEEKTGTYYVRKDEPGCLCGGRGPDEMKEELSCLCCADVHVLCRVRAEESG